MKTVSTQYRFCKPGVYSVSAQASGFSLNKDPDIILQIQDTLEIDLRLTVGGASEQVEVSGGGTPVVF